LDKNSKLMPWIFLALAFMTSFLMYGVSYGYGIILPSMIDSLGLTYGEAGLIMTSNSIAFAIFAIIAGTLTDRIGGRMVISVFIAVAGIGTMLMGTANSVLASCIFFAIFGIGMSGNWAPFASFLQTWFDVKRRGTVLGIMTVGIRLGYGTMTLVLPLLIAAYDWRLCWYMLGGLLLLIAAINGLILRDKKSPSSSPPKGSVVGSIVSTKQKISYRNIFSKPHFWVIGISYLAMSLFAVGTVTFIVTYANIELGMPYNIAAALSGIIAFIGIPGAIILPALSDRFGRKILLVVSNIAMAFFVLIIALSGHNFMLLISSAALFGFFYGGIFPSYSACAGDYFPATTIGTVLGMWSTFCSIGMMMAGPIVGFAADFSGTFLWSFVLNAFIGIFAAMLLLLLKYPHYIENRSQDIKRG
jgi:MFS family permease